MDITCNPAKQNRIKSVVDPSLSVLLSSTCAYTDKQDVIQKLRDELEYMKNKNNSLYGRIWYLLQNKETSDPPPISSRDKISQIMNMIRKHKQQQDRINELYAMISSIASKTYDM